MKGQGAYLNQSIRLPLSHPHPLPLNSLGEALIGGEWGSDRSKAVRPFDHEGPLLYRRKLL